jgi:N-dimethylarginine dimethylaminohydrolase
MTAPDLPNKKSRVLMCAPDAYDLKYEINAWMSLQNRPDLSLAAQQWAQLYQVMTDTVGIQVDLIPQASDTPDQVFTANAGLVVGKRLLLSNFRHPERQREAPYFRDWFEQRGYEVIAPPEPCKFEGEGDALFAGDVLLAGYLKRSDICSHQWLGEMLQRRVISLELVDARWYHLDTALFPLSGGWIVYYPGAFDLYARRVLEANFRLIEVVTEEALKFACNSVVIGDQIVMPAGCPNLQSALELRGYRVYPVPLSEFIKSGGAAKCLTLYLE